MRGLMATSLYGILTIRSKRGCFLERQFRGSKADAGALPGLDAAMAESCREKKK
jgi:hypothetical protein